MSVENEKEIQQLKNRIRELADKSYNQNQYTFTGFLGLAEQDALWQVEREVKFAGITLYGGREEAERKLLRFGSEAELGYEQPFPICCIRIRPLSAKFADKLSHRDYLGALMNLGIEREMTGDIVMKESSRSGKRNTAYVFCVSSIADYITDNLTRIKHTNVRCIICPDDDLPDIVPTLEEFQCIAASERIDAAIASITKLSRSQTVALFREKKVFLNNRILENNSYNLKPEDTLSIRGYGKFIYKGCGHETRKGRIYLTFERYV